MAFSHLKGNHYQGTIFATSSKTRKNIALKSLSLS